MILSMRELYDDESISLKDAIIRFGNGCSGVIVSESGLLMTNYHCALRYVEQVSTKECDYLSEGYWAEEKPEIPIEGLSVRRLIKMEDVTDSLRGVDGSILPEKERKEKIEILEKGCTDKMFGYEGKVAPMFSGNRYYLCQYQVFDDIRMVGVPPLSLGKFGKDADNWMWPRHTADFALFRIYANQDNLPASYSPENVPYRPKRFAPISLKPLKEGDFTFILGFPGSTDQHKHSEVLSNLVEVSYPIQIDLMSKYLALLSSYMERDASFEMRNTAQYGSVSNVMKRYQGFITGMNRSQGIEKRKDEEAFFEECLRKDSVSYTKYGSLLDEMKQVEQEKVAYAIPYSMYLHFPSLTKNASKLEEWAESIYRQSALTDTIRLHALLENHLDSLKKDPAVSLINEITGLYVNKVWCCLPQLSQRLDSLKKEYVTARMALFGAEDCWPDANGTMRFSYGTIKGYQNKDKAHPYYTTLESMFQKVKTGNAEYAVPPSFQALYEKREFGDYAVNGTIPTCFIATNHTVGGNSGSPVFNASGELIGLNFDRNWEGTISDVMYDESVCRNITVDMRYVLFIIDKYAEASSILKELVIHK